MANKDLELALRIKADLQQGVREMVVLEAALEDVGQAATTTSAQLGRVSETVEQQAQRIGLMVRASIDQRTALDALSDANQRGAQTARQLADGWQSTAAAQSAVMSSSSEAARAAGQLAAAEERTAKAAKAAAAAIDQEAVDLAELLGKIDPVIAKLDQLDALEKQLRATRASGRIDLDTYDNLNAKLTAQRAALTGTAQTMRAAGITAGQYQQAMRQLPMQLTDVTTSLVSGMPIWMVAIQQGGQIKDSFGGVGNAARALVSLINPLTVAVGAAAAAAGAYVIALESTAREHAEFDRALIQTGNYAGQTSASMDDLARSVGGNEIGRARDILTGLAASGRVGASVFESVSKAAIAMAQMTGQSADQVVSQFARMQDGVGKWAREANRQYHVFDTATLSQIDSLEEQGRTIEATQLISEKFFDSANERSKELEKNLTTLQSIWKGLGDTIKGGWGSFKDFVNETAASFSAMQKPLTEVSDGDLEALLRLQERLARWAPSENSAQYYDQANAIRYELARREELELQKGESREKDEQADAAMQRIGKRQIESLTQEERKQRELNALVEDYVAAWNNGANVADPKLRGVTFENGRPSGGQYEIDRQRIETKFAEKTPRPKADTELKNQQSYVAQLERQAATLGKNAGEVRQYELAEKNLTGTLQARAAAALALIDADEKKRAVDADNKQLASINAQLLAAQGNSAAAVTAQLEQQYGELLKRLADRGDQAGTDLVKKLINVEQAKAQLTDLQRVIDSVFAEQARQEGSIQAQQQAGLISEIGARQQIVDLHAQTAVEVEKLLPQMKALAEATGDPAAIERLKNLKAQLAETKLVANEVTNAFRSGFEDGLAGALQGLAQGTMDLREAATSFVQSIAGSLSQLASQKLAAMAFDNIFGSVLQTAPQAVTAIGTVAAAKTTADATMTASGATAAAASTATQVEAAAATTAAWTPASIAASIGSWGAAAAIGLAAVVAALAFKAFADGGHVRGPGTGTSDSIPAWLSNNEFVTRAAVVGQAGALPFLKDFNARGMAALPDWANVVRHATGGLAGVPAPSMPAPSRSTAQLAEPAANFNATLKNSQNFYLIDDPQRLTDTLKTRAGEEALAVMISRDPGKFRSLLNING
jgi:phage-related minor tail protein